MPDADELEVIQETVREIVAGLRERDLPGPAREWEEAARRLREGAKRSAVDAVELFGIDVGWLSEKMLKDTKRRRDVQLLEKLKRLGTQVLGYRNHLLQITQGGRSRGR